MLLSCLKRFFNRDAQSEHLNLGPSEKAEALTSLYSMTVTDLYLILISCIPNGKRSAQTNRCAVIAYLSGESGFTRGPPAGVGKQIT